MPKIVRSFEELDCWRACRELRRFIAFDVVRALPGDERFLMRPQMLRAARSTTANIAEGFGRYHFLDNAKFCSIARGSCSETLDHLITAVDEGLIDPALLVTGREKFGHADRTLTGYIAYLKRAARS